MMMGAFQSTAAQRIRAVPGRMAMIVTPHGPRSDATVMKMVNGQRTSTENMMTPDTRMIVAGPRTAVKRIMKIVSVATKHWLAWRTSVRWVTAVR